MEDLHPEGAVVEDVIAIEVASLRYRKYQKEMKIMKVVIEVVLVEEAVENERLTVKLMLHKKEHGVVEAQIENKRGKMKKSLMERKKVLGLKVVKRNRK